MRAIAIDGPAGVGKSTAAKNLSIKLGYIYVDTGALYRAIAHYTLSRGVGVNDEEAVSALLAGVKIELRFVDNEQRVFLNGEDITNKIRSEAVSMAASAVSALPAVRGYLLSLQREIANENNVVMDGRDIGTVVLPNADLKIFLTASPEERAKRRYGDLLKKGISADYDTVLQSLIKRDFDDSHRDISPLRPADDAIMVDTTENEVERTSEVLFKIVEENLKDVLV